MLLGQDIPDDCQVMELSGVLWPDTAHPVELRSYGSRLTVHYVVAPAHGDGMALAEFTGVRASYLGSPNDEARGGHRLAARGLRNYAFHEVINSDWISELERRNRVHPGHSKSLFAGLHHDIVTLKEETFECIARSMTVSRLDEGAP